MVRRPTGDNESPGSRSCTMCSNCCSGPPATSPSPTLGRGDGRALGVGVAEFMERFTHHTGGRRSARCPALGSTASCSIATASRARRSVASTRIGPRSAARGPSGPTTSPASVPGGRRHARAPASTAARTTRPSRSGSSGPRIGWPVGERAGGGAHWRAGRDVRRSGARFGRRRGACRCGSLVAGRPAAAADRPNHARAVEPDLGGCLPRSPGRSTRRAARSRVIREDRATFLRGLEPLSSRTCR